MKNLLLLILLLIGGRLFAFDNEVEFDTDVDCIRGFPINASLKLDSQISFLDSCQLVFGNIIENKTYDFVLRVNMDFSQGRQIEVPLPAGNGEMVSVVYNELSPMEGLQVEVPLTADNGDTFLMVYNGLTPLKESSGDTFLMIYNELSPVKGSCCFDKKKTLSFPMSLKNKDNKNDDYFIDITTARISITPLYLGSEYYVTQINLKILISDFQKRVLYENILPLKYFIKIYKSKNRVRTIENGGFYANDFTPLYPNHKQFKIKIDDPQILYIPRTDSFLSCHQNYQLTIGTVKLVGPFQGELKNAVLDQTKQYFFPKNKDSGLILNVDRTAVPITVYYINDSYKFTVVSSQYNLKIREYSNQVFVSGTTLIEVYNNTNRLIGYFGLPFCKSFTIKER